MTHASNRLHLSANNFPESWKRDENLEIKVETPSAFGIRASLTRGGIRRDTPCPMKKRSQSASLRPNGILRWSTACVLASALASCDSDYTATEKDADMAKVQSRIDALDSQKALLTQGQVSNNFEIPGVGYYHAEKRDFFTQAYNSEANGQWFVDGAWKSSPGPDYVPPSRPSAAALKKVDEALSRQQKEEQQGGGGGSNVTQHHGGGFGAGNMLMMYWLLSGNRGFFSPGSGFQQADRNAPNWNQSVNQSRRDVASHAAGNPGYARMVEQSRVQGTPVKPGQSVRGGFGSTRSGGGGGFSSGG